MRVTVYLSILFVVCSTLIGCASNQPKIATRPINTFPNQFEIVGKIGASDGKRGATVNFRWKQLDPKHHTVFLSGPLGSQSVQVTYNADLVTITRANGEILTASRPEDIIATEFNWQIPISSLEYWLQGKKDPTQPIEKIEKDALKRLKMLQQNGWSIYYKTYKTVQGFPVPYKITLLRAPVQLQFILQRWYLD